MIPGLRALTGSIKPEPKSNGVAAPPLGSLAMVFLLVSSTVAVVMIADLMPEGDHDGYTLFTRAAIPVTCGHAMEVPDRTLKRIPFLAGDHAAKMFSPGAATSGFRISGVSELGPLEENAATRGASRSPKTVFAGKISVQARL